MRVLLLNQTFYPDPVATSQQLLDFAEHLCSHGCEVTVLASRRSYNDPDKVHPAEETVRGIRIVRVAGTGFGRRSFFHRLIDGVTFELRLLWKLLFFPRQDVVVAFTSPPLIGFVALLFTALRGGKCVQWVMDLNPDIAFAVGYLKPKSFFGRFLTAVLRFSCRNSDYVIVLDRWMRQRMLGHGVAAERIVVVPPWPVSAPTPLRKELGQRFRQRHGITESFVLLYSGNHSIAHPLDTVLQTALEMRDNPDVLFLFIGGGLREKDVTLFAAAHQLRNIRQLPYQPRELLPESLSAADLHLVVMGEQMSGLVHVSKIYGVLTTGAPYVFIGPRASHVADLLKECPYGFHVESSNTHGLAQVISRTRSLKENERETIFKENTEYVAKHCSAAHSLVGFTSRILQPSGAGEKRVPPAAQLPSRA